MGGGAAGLSTAGALKKAGLAPVVFDRGDDVGASWMQRQHVPIPKSYPKYLSREMYAEYLRAYRDALALNVVQQCRVTHVERTAATGRSGVRFTLATNNGSIAARSVVIATGMFGVPIQAAFDGLDGYRGVAIHSSRYRSGEAFRDKRVLVVGVGNTGAEIAADLVEHGAKFVAVSVRARRLRSSRTPSPARWRASFSAI